MQTKTSPSVNIIRDAGRQIRYVPTANAQNTVDNIIDNFNSGFHSSVIIGSYGTGKSSLIWAFEQTLKGEGNYFQTNKLKCKKGKVGFVRFVGEYESIIQSFAEQLNVKKLSAGNQQVFDALFQKYEPFKKDGLLVVFIDEFGKYLEFAAKHNAEKELYFVQQLAEFVNHPDRNILLISTLHQNFEAYGFGLNERQRNEWTKVRGRLKEITFNEPIEQLLKLAADYTNAKPDTKTQAAINQINKAVLQYKLFGVKKEFIIQTGHRIFPLDFISGYCLTRALQKYGQNERSLFTFLESREFKNVSADGNSFFNLIWLYDYLWVNFYSFLRSKHNPDFLQWNDISYTIERIESLIEDRSEDAINAAKVIGLLNILCSKGARLNADFLNSYLTDACKMSRADIILKELDTFKLIKYSKFNDSYRLFQGTDIDIEDAFDKAAKSIDEIADVSLYLKKHFGQLPLVTAKEITYLKGTPRIFQFITSESPQSIVPSGETDGYINLIINEEMDEVALARHSKAEKEANVYGLFRNSDKIKNYLTEIEKAQRVKNDNLNDTVVKREMDIIINSTKNLLKHYFIDAIYTDHVSWYYQGNRQEIHNKARFNKLLSKVAREIYPFTPDFRNELVNRHKISPTIHGARKEYFTSLVNNWTEKELGYDEERFPADKTIYISLLRENGMHVEDKAGFVLAAPGSKSSFKAIWKACENFLQQSKQERKPLSELYELLSGKPYKLKLGLIELWIPTFLFIKRDDFALFGENGYIPDLNESTLPMLVRNPDEFSIKAFSIEGPKLDLFNKYRELLLQKEETKPSNNSFIETIKPFLTFYKQLPEYTKNTKTGLSAEALAVREAIIKAEDPEKTFFEDFPKALHTDAKELAKSKEDLQAYSAKLKSTITEIRTAYDELVNRFESELCKEVTGSDADFDTYKKALQQRFRKVKAFMLLNYHKAFLQRVNSPIDDKKTWLSSVAQSLINKSLDTLKDEDVQVLFHKLKTVVHELDNFTELAVEKVDEAREKVFKFEITSERSVNKKIVKIPKTKFKELEQAEKQVKAILKKDVQLNIALLTKLLQEQLKNDKE